MSAAEKLRTGLAIPAHPLALTAGRKLDERRQRALTRYYLAAGAGGIAVGVHTTQFAIRDPAVGLHRPVLELAAEETRECEVVKIAGICGGRSQAIKEAELAASLGYDAGLLSLGGLFDASVAELLEHTAQIGSILPVIGFYLQPSVGGRPLSYCFWRQFADIPSVIAIKIAPFNRYQTIDVIRAISESSRAGEIALYTGNDDNILLDLLSTFELGGERVRIVGGLLGQWAVWTRNAVRLLEKVKQARVAGASVPPEFFPLAHRITDANAALFDPVHQFRGCIPGIHEVLRRQGLLAGRWCLDPYEDLSPGQSAEIDRVYQIYPELRDDEFVQEHLDEWLR